MRMFLRKKFEVILLKIAAWIVLERNVPRSPVVSRRDNNRMFEMGYELKDIVRRIEEEYKKD